MNENKFDGMGKIYSKYRPTYPKSFIKYLYNEVGILKDSVIADIGAGTGILTKLLLERGNKVYAVEPNKDMANEARNSLKEYSNLIYMANKAEDTGLDINSIDFITVAQAFHWFNREEFKKECRRILKPDGKIILVWNSRDSKSSLVMDNDLINRKYCKNFKGFSGNMRGAENPEDFKDFFLGNYDIKLFQNDILFDEERFIGRNLSSSYAPKEWEDNYSEYIDALKELFNKYAENNILRMPNITRSYVGIV